MLVRLFVRHARIGKYTAQELRNLYAPNVTVRRVQQILAAMPDLRWARLPRAPTLSEKHKDARLLWARKPFAVSASFWRRTVFSDEKRKTLDGPDGLAFYWKDSRRPARWFSQRQRDGGSVMV